MRWKYRRFVGLAALAASGLGVAILAACSSPTAAPAASEPAMIESAIQTACNLVGPISCANPGHFADVTPILAKSCNPCHTADAAQGEWPLTDYGDVAAWTPLIQRDLCLSLMPPLDGGVALAPADRLAILDWIQCGAAE
jgi:cytochrome c5